MTQEDKYKEALLEVRAVLEPCLKYSNKIKQGTAIPQKTAPLSNLYRITFVLHEI